MPSQFANQSFVEIFAILAAVIADSVLTFYSSSSPPEKLVIGYFGTATFLSGCAANVFLLASAVYLGTSTVLSG